MGELVRELLTDKTPVPWFKNVVPVICGIGEYEAESIAVQKEPLVRRRLIKSGKRAARPRGNKIHCRSELVFGISLVGGELIGRARAIRHRVLPFERALLLERAKWALDVGHDTVAHSPVEQVLEMGEYGGVDLLRPRL